MRPTILVPLEDTPQSRRVLPYVTRLTAASHGHLVLMQAISDRDLRDHAEEQLTHLAEQISLDGTHDVEIEVREGDAESSILSAAAARHADFIAMATDRWTDVDRWLNGSVVDRVARHTSVPLLLVPPECSRAWDGDRLLDVLVPLDGSALAESALQPASSFAQLLDSRLILLRAVDNADEADAARNYLQAIARGSSVRPGCGVALGEASAAITHAACAINVGLIVMATHGRGGLARLALGSVATRVLQQSNCPVVLLHPTLPTGDD